MTSGIHLDGGPARSNPQHRRSRPYAPTLKELPWHSASPTPSRERFLVATYGPFLDKGSLDGPIARRHRAYRSARRVFWIMDNASSHRGEACRQRLLERWPTIIPVHTPVHASWLNQVEIYFSIVQRKVLTPNDLESRAQLEDRLMRFQNHYEAIAKPFDWRFTRRDLRELLVKLDQRSALESA